MALYRKTRSRHGAASVSLFNGCNTVGARRLRPRIIRGAAHPRALTRAVLHPKHPARRTRPLAPSTEHFALPLSTYLEDSALSAKRRAPRAGLSARHEFFARDAMQGAGR